MLYWPRQIRVNSLKALNLCSLWKSLIKPERGSSKNTIFKIKAENTRNSELERRFPTKSVDTFRLQFTVQDVIRGFLVTFSAIKSIFGLDLEPNLLYYRAPNDARYAYTFY